MTTIQKLDGWAVDSEVPDHPLYIVVDSDGISLLANEDRMYEYVESITSDGLIGYYLDGLIKKGCTILHNDCTDTLTVKLPKVTEEE